MSGSLHVLSLNAWQDHEMSMLYNMLCLCMYMICMRAWIWIHYWTDYMFLMCKYNNSVWHEVRHTSWSVLFLINVRCEITGQEQVATYVTQGQTILINMNGNDEFTVHSVFILKNVQLNLLENNNKCTYRLLSDVEGVLTVFPVFPVIGGSVNI